LFATKLNAVRAFKVYYQVSFDDSVFYRPPNYTGPKGIYVGPKGILVGPKGRRGWNGVRWRVEVKWMREG
jgi:hypothetical protein